MPTQPGEEPPFSEFTCCSIVFVVSDSVKVSVCLVIVYNSSTYVYAVNQFRPDLTKERFKLVAYPL